jgi:hypothetical protein
MMNQTTDNSGDARRGTPHRPNEWTVRTAIFGRFLGPSLIRVARLLGFVGASA